MSDQIIDPVLALDKRHAVKAKFASNGAVLVIYSGGTIGSAPRDRNDPESPEIVYPWSDLQEAVSGLQRISFRVDAISFVEPLDSANVGPKHWQAMAETIEKYYDQYTGFVVAHGTDTMVYTASALSFILQNLGKPVIITGSQIPALDKVRNDAEQNLITSLLIANHLYSKIPCVPEVCIFFRDKLVRGCRSKKLNASGYGAFDSPNYELLGTVGDQIDINEKFIKSMPTSTFQIQPDLNTNVVTLDIFPGMQENKSLYSAILDPEKFKGIVLKTYGAGNIPTDPSSFGAAIKKAVDDGAIVMNVTQCVEGDVQQGLYDTSAVLQDMGVISGQDITTEAALCKMMNVLGDEDMRSLTERKKLISRNLAGEQSCSMSTTSIDLDSHNLGTKNGNKKRYRSPKVAIQGFHGDGGLVDRCLIRFVGAKVEVPDAKEVFDRKLYIQIYLNLAARTEPEKSLANFAGAYLKSVDNDKQTFTFDIAQTARKELRTESIISVNVVADGHDGTFSWDRLEMTLFTRD